MEPVNGKESDFEMADRMRFAMILFASVFAASLCLSVLVPSLEQLKAASEPSVSGHGAAKP